MSTLAVDAPPAEPEPPITSTRPSASCAEATSPRPAVVRLEVGDHVFGDSALAAATSVTIAPATVATTPSLLRCIPCPQTIGYPTRLPPYSIYGRSRNRLAGPPASSRSGQPCLSHLRPSAAPSARDVASALRTLDAQIGQSKRRRIDAHTRHPAKPLGLVRRAPLPRRSEVRPLSPAAVERMRAASSDRDGALLSVFAYAGLRPGEALALR